VAAAAALVTAAAGVALFGAGTAGAAAAPAGAAFPSPDAPYGTSQIGGTSPMCPIIAPVPTSPPSVTGPDSEPPTAPDALLVRVCGGALYVTWSLGRDNIGVQRWTLYRLQGDVISAIPTTMPGYRLTSFNSYEQFSVDAVDYAGNHSVRSAWVSYGTPPTCTWPTLCATTPPPPTCPPVTQCVPRTSAPPVPTCAVTYTIVSQWTGGFQGEVKIRNNGSAAVNPWTLGFSFPGGQQIGQIWGATQTQSGAAVTARGVDWNKVIPAGGSVSFGFIGTWTGSNAKPTAFTLNGGGCQAA
jgi:cellulase/cellobiase CelA1